MHYPMLTEAYNNKYKMKAVLQEISQKNEVYVKEKEKL